MKLVVRTGVTAVVRPHIGTDTTVSKRESDSSWLMSNYFKDCVV